MFTLIGDDAFPQGRDVLSISESEVSENWRFGMLRAAGKLLAERGRPASDATGYYGSPTPTGNYAHIAGGVAGVVPCTIISVSDIREEETSWEEGSTFGSTTYHRTVLLGRGKCLCGKVDEDISYHVYLGDLIMELANTCDRITD